ncbi:hypothetical protein BBO99_00000721 [Phytophthora kernoviae]|uniref:Protein kinase domain-containing protein n=1 Tax=Phytophthora kernoviae TaxID=325452 RepID=A0A3R7NMA9_9STRA|nr:hypothetical protein JM16_005941 [Phytophthora kernoviae]KAG2523856.1 hypothetical protein JM18_005600 [Phytophthora kernoviae]RLN27351.1 hypothetical protein BBI17_002735 [Phytophthora kernoviae]RLN85229.1 hypothetical protein BBO99_00000721 [Phytophthora kernoviae]
MGVDRLGLDEVDREANGLRLQRGREVAIKLPAELTVDAIVNRTVNLNALDKQVNSIAHECNAMSRVQHPNVLRVDRAVPGKKLDYDYVAMVTEFAPNGDLFELLDVKGALPEVLVKVYASQLLHALAACHASGVVHRDVKPENLLLSTDFQLKLCDFGVAAMIPEGESDVVSQDESGTMMYMAPEVRARRPYRCTPVDVWSTGVVLFILVTGLPPFNEAQQGDVWYNCLLKGDLKNFWARQPDEVKCRMTYGARDLISKMLTVNPEQRITVTQALQHPWLQGIEHVDPALVREEVSAYLA